MKPLLPLWPAGLVRSVVRLLRTRMPKYISSREFFSLEYSVSRLRLSVGVLNCSEPTRPSRVRSLDEP